MNKAFYKIFLWILKYTPNGIALIYLIGTILGLLGYSTWILSFIFCVGVIPLFYLWLSSFAFRFCIWHRMPLYDILANQTVSLLSLTIGLTISQALITHVIIFGIFVLLAAYLKNKYNECKRNNKTNVAADNR